MEPQTSKTILSVTTLWGFLLIAGALIKFQMYQEVFSLQSIIAGTSIMGISILGLVMVHKIDKEKSY